LPYIEVDKLRNEHGLRHTIHTANHGTVVGTNRLGKRPDTTQLKEGNANVVKARQRESWRFFEKAIAIVDTVALKHPGIQYREGEGDSELVLRALA